MILHSILNKNEKVLNVIFIFNPSRRGPLEVARGPPHAEKRCCGSEVLMGEKNLLIWMTKYTKPCDVNDKITSVNTENWSIQI